MGRSWRTLKKAPNNTHTSYLDRFPTVVTLGVGGNCYLIIWKVATWKPKRKKACGFGHNHYGSSFETPRQSRQHQRGGTIRPPQILYLWEVGGSIPSCEISSLFDRNLSGGQMSLVLWHWLVGLLSQNKNIIPMFSKWPWNMIHLMPWGIHVDFTSILHSHTPLVPEHSVKRTWTGSTFSTKWLKCDGHGLSVLCVKWPLCGHSY